MLKIKRGIRAASSAGVFILAVLCSVLLSCSQECEHEYGQWHVMTEPTCSAVGVRVRVCNLCMFEDVSEQEKLPHTLELVSTWDNSCVAKGTKTSKCTVCSELVTESVEVREYSVKEIYERAQKYVCEITTYDRHGDKLGIGTGVVFGTEGQVLTNYHVIRGAYRAEAIIDGKLYKIAKVKKSDEKKDLAVVVLGESVSSHAVLCTIPPEVGETVYAMGSPRGMTNTITTGAVTYSEREIDGVVYIQHDASITNGNSGGPLFNIYGEVIGINTMTLKDSQNLNFAVSVAELNKIDKSCDLSLKEYYKTDYLGSPYAALTKVITDNGTEDSKGHFIMRLYENVCWTLSHDKVDDEVLLTVMYTKEDVSIIVFLHIPRSDSYSEWVECYAIIKYQNTMFDISGRIHPQTYTREGKIYYDNFAGSDTYKIQDVDYTSLWITAGLVELSKYLGEINAPFTLADLGFASFS